MRSFAHENSSHFFLATVILVNIKIKKVNVNGKKCRFCFFLPFVGKGT